MARMLVFLPKGSRKNNLAFCCDSHSQLNHNQQTALVCRASEPQPHGARPELARDPRRCHHIACVAAACICLPGARAKMPTNSCANPKSLSNSLWVCPHCTEWPTARRAPVGAVTDIPNASPRPTRSDFETKEN